MHLEEVNSSYDEYCNQVYGSTNRDDSYKRPPIIQLKKQFSWKKSGTNMYELKGNWDKGVTYDIHTLHSEHYLDEHGNDRWNNTRSIMGELVYQLKYKNDLDAVDKIIDLLHETITITSSIDAIIPIPPSNLNRAIQPVYSIATEFGKRFNISVLFDILTKSGGNEELKSITDQDERQEILKKTMNIETNSHQLTGKTILLIDDLYRSGSTLSVATELLYNVGKVSKVIVLTMTKTRSNR